MALGSYLGELKTQVHKFTCSPSQSRPRSSERWFLGDSWAGGLRPRFCANVNDLLNIRCSGKRRHAQLSKQWGRGHMEAQLFIQLVLNASLLANVLENLFHYPRNGKNQESCKLSLSPSLHCEAICRKEGTLLHLGHQMGRVTVSSLKTYFNWGVISMKLNMRPLVVQMDGFW